MDNFSNIFKQFSTEAILGSSKLYSSLAAEIAEDPFLLNLASHVRSGQPPANLLLGSIHYLLLNNYNHPLRSYYPSICPSPAEEGTFAAFKDFCKTYKSDIVRLLQTKLVQTNEVRRCAYLYPCFSYIYQQTNQPLALIEIGTSAGFQLLWDEYSYTYNSSKTVITHKSKVHIKAQIIGKGEPPLPSHTPPVTHRYGIDLHLNDMNNTEHHAWLHALIWPEHIERRRLFEQAADSVKQASIQLIEGDGVELLPSVAEQIPKDSIICVFHTHAANQMTAAAKTKLNEHIERIGSKRNIAHLYNHMTDAKLHLDLIVNKERQENVAGETDGHGRWFTWELH
ncbi:DUF2332 domain-containing protein [Halobacillus sp. A5]|uniref:DUF2332 domain-containing protein n=1 Tax=Halobacillus sp. A5 TaxID=2880263 RepID=UPI0020A684D6|nr:DUF2332 domain-containing protein [Halobacillus sp. A5]MCP3027321.1 DUF2332 domain-containing protein [Halobacillus sp. A5]